MQNRLLKCIVVQHHFVYTFIELLAAICCCGRQVNKRQAAAGPLPEFSSRGAKNQKEGPKTRRRGHILKILCWIYAATRGPNVKWGGTDFKRGGRAPLAPPLATALSSIQLCFTAVHSRKRGA